MPVHYWWLVFAALCFGFTVVVFTYDRSWRVESKRARARRERREAEDHLLTVYLWALKREDEALVAAVRLQAAISCYDLSAFGISNAVPSPVVPLRMPTPGPGRKVL